VGDDGTNSGSAYVSVQDGNNCALQQKLLPAGVETEDRFGDWVDIDGGTIVVASSFDDLANNDGAVNAFVRNDTVWSGQQQLLPTLYAPIASRPAS
jgi:hypothetical protein